MQDSWAIKVFFWNLGAAARFSLVVSLCGAACFGRNQNDLDFVSKKAELPGGAAVVFEYLHIQELGAWLDIFDPAGFWYNGTCRSFPGFSKPPDRWSWFAAVVKFEEISFCISRLRRRKNPD